MTTLETLVEVIIDWHKVIEDSCYHSSVIDVISILKDYPEVEHLLDMPHRQLVELVNEAMQIAIAKEDEECA